MDKNVGGLDRTARLALGLLLVAAAVGGLLGAVELGLTLVMVALVVGAVLLVTGSLQYCPLWAVAGVNTSRR